MRLVLIPLLLFAVAPAWAATPSIPPPSAVNLVRLHPRAWSPPEPALRAGIRFDPETGETAAESPGFGRSATRASLRAQAEARVRMLPDGSRHAVVGAAFRS